MGLGSAQMPRYFSVIPPALVTRFGTGTYLGASIRFDAGHSVIEWDPDRIVEISDNELTQYLREYAGLVRDGSLVEHKVEDYRAYCELEAEAAAVAQVIAEPVLDSAVETAPKLEP